MPGAATLSSPGALAGMTLRAWALIGAGGSLQKGFNVSSITPGAAGVITLNLTQAMPDAIVMLDWRVMVSAAATPQGYVRSLSATTGAVTYTVGQGTADAFIPHYIAVYG